MRTRLRPAYAHEQLARLYSKPHEHARWEDHRLRVALTIQVAQFMYPGGLVADLSCGDAAIARAVQADGHILGDLAPGYGFHGPIERTADRIPDVGLFVCCETLEHLDDPDTVLRAIRQKTRALVLSTPNGEHDPACNPEHYWGWDTEDVRAMLTVAGFTPVIQTGMEMPHLGVRYQIWGCQ